MFVKEIVPMCKIKVPEKIISIESFFDSFVDKFGKDFKTKEKWNNYGEVYFVFEVENEIINDNRLYEPIVNDDYKLIGLKAPNNKEIRFD